MRKPLFGLLTILSVLLSHGTAIVDAVELKRLETGLEVGPRPSFTSPARELSLFQLNGSQTVEETLGFDAHDGPTPRKLPLGPFLTAVDACGPTAITELKLVKSGEAKEQAKAVSSRISDDLKQWAFRFFAERNKFNVGGLKLQRLYMNPEIQEVDDSLLPEDQEKFKGVSTSGFETQFMFLYATDKGQFTDPENEYFLRVEVFLKSDTETVTVSNEGSDTQQEINKDTITVLLRLAAKKKVQTTDVKDGGGIKEKEIIGSPEYVLLATVTLADNPPETDLAPKLWASAGVAFKLVVAASVRAFEPSFLFPEWCGFEGAPYAQSDTKEDIRTPLYKAGLKNMESVIFKDPEPFDKSKWSPITVGWSAEPFVITPSNSFASLPLDLNDLKNVDEAVKGQLRALLTRGQAFRRAWPSAPTIQQITLDQTIKLLPFSNIGLADLLKLDVCPFLTEKRDLCEFFFYIKSISDLKITPDVVADDKPLFFRLGWSQSLEVNLSKEEKIVLVCVETETTLQAQLANDLECGPDPANDKETDARKANGERFELPLRIIARKLLLLQFEAFSRLSQFDILSFALASLAFENLSSVTKPEKKIGGGDEVVEQEVVDNSSQLTPAEILNSVFANPLAKIDKLENFSLNIVQTEATVDFELALDSKKYMMLRGTLDSVLPDYSKLTLNSGQQTLELLIPLYPTLPKGDLESFMTVLAAFKNAGEAADAASVNKRAYFATEYAANIIEFGATLRAKIENPESKPTTVFDEIIFGSQAISFSMIVGLFQEVMLDDMESVQVFQSGMLSNDGRLGCLGVNYGVEVKPLTEFTTTSKVKAVLAKSFIDGGANGSDPMKPEFWSFPQPEEEMTKENSPFFEIPSLTDTTLVLSATLSKFQDGNLLLQKVNEGSCGSSANAVSLEFYMLKHKKRVDAKLHFYDGDMFKSVQVSFESVYFSHSFVLPIWELHELKDMFKTVAERMVKHYNRIANAVIDPKVGASYGSFNQVLDTLEKVFDKDKLCFAKNEIIEEDLKTIKTGSVDLYWTIPSAQQEKIDRRLGVSRRADGSAGKKTKQVFSPGFFFERRLSKSIGLGTQQTPLGRKSRLLRTNGPVPRRLHEIKACGEEEKKKANLFLACVQDEKNPWTLSFAGEVSFGSAKKPVPINSSINFAPDYAYNYEEIIISFKENILSPDKK